MNAKTKKWLHMVAFILVIFGGINWGLFGLIPDGQNGLDVLNYLLPGDSGLVNTLREIVYILIGVSAVYLAATHTKDCKVCAQA